MKQFFLLVLLTLLSLTSMQAQVGLGFVVGNDVYQRYVNPDGGSAGNAILNLHIGPKIWIGGQNFSVSVEAHANWGSTALSVGDYKGMGNLALPLLAKLNFNANSGFNTELTSGWSIGGGYQMSRTEWYGVNTSAAQEDVVREFYPVMIGEIGYGYGISGFIVESFIRYGWDTQSKASTLNVGISYNINLRGFTKLKRKLDRFDD
ncbi:hypothetical protein [Portibacter marinus]|uniref:hypothetical protein n=1 Tax=Portibacter marinus TaxID=2898660 RepID=UPI001F23F0C8|nr:hypothetical protein [Portibacter marinus]